VTLHRSPHVLVDPTHAEAGQAVRQLIVAMDSPKRKIAHLIVSGIFSAAELKDMLEAGIESCEVYDERLRKAAHSHFQDARL
jgi:ribonuclease PH